MRFVNRTEELGRLEAWWSGGGAALGLVWGRRRVGKTLLLQRFAENRPRTIYHTFAGRATADELAVLSGAWPVGQPGGWEPYLPADSWTKLLAALAREASEEPLLLILDEFQEGVSASPELPGVIRALWDDRGARGRLRILLCGSAMRTMEAIQEEGAPLYGRFDLNLLVHPFAPHEAALMLPELDPQQRAVVWGLVGGMPPYLDRWDQSAGVEENIRTLFCSPGGRLLVEGDLALRGEMLADVEVQVLHAIALGRTQYAQIHNALHREPSRQLERLIELRLVERVQPVTEEGSRARRRVYRLADNFLAFWLGQVLPHRAAIDRGLGDGVAGVIAQSLPDFLGPRWEEAFRIHLRRLAAAGELGEGVVAVGPFWAHERLGDDGRPLDTEIDAVALSGRSREATLAGEAKLSPTIDARPVLAALRRKVERLPRRAADLRLAVASPLAVTKAPPGTLIVTADDIFG